MQCVMRVQDGSFQSVRQAWRDRQRGFSLIEISMVTAIMMLIAIIGIPAIQAYVIENKTPRVAEEIQRFVARLKSHTHGFGVAPYSGVNGATLANALRSSTVVSVNGSDAGASVAHGLGGKGAAGHGVITIAPQSIQGAAHGAAFAITLNHVNHAACPGVASILQRIADVVTISGKSGSVIVKDMSREPGQPYDALLADEQCISGDRNTFTFTFR